MSGLNDCCKNPANRYVFEKRDDGKIVVQKCSVCGRSHYSMLAEPGTITPSRPDLQKKVS